MKLFILNIFTISKKLGIKVGNLGECIVALFILDTAFVVKYMS